MSKTVLTGGEVITSVPNGSPRTLTAAEIAAGAATLIASNDVIYTGTLTANTTLTLPALSTMAEGQSIKLINTNRAANFWCKLDCAGADTFDDLTTYISTYQGNLEVAKYNSLWVVMKGKKYMTFTQAAQAGAFLTTVVTDVDIVEAMTRITSDFATAAADLVTFTSAGRYNFHVFCKAGNTAVGATVLDLTLTDTLGTTTLGTAQASTTTAADYQYIHLHIYDRLCLTTGVTSTVKVRLLSTGNTCSTAASAGDEYCLYIEKVD